MTLVTDEGYVRYLETASEDSIKEFIKVRLNHQDNVTPLVKERDEDPVEVFGRTMDLMLECGKEKHVIRFLKALSLLIKETYEKKKDQREAFMDLLILAEVANTDGIQSVGISCEELADTLFNMVNAERDNLGEEFDIEYYRMLCALLESQSKAQFDNTTEFWNNILRSEHYCLSAFEAVVRWDHKKAVGLIPAMLTVCTRNLNSEADNEIGWQIAIESLFFKFFEEEETNLFWQLSVMAFNGMNNSKELCIFNETMHDIIEVIPMPLKLV